MDYSKLSYSELISAKNNLENLLLSARSIQEKTSLGSAIIKIYEKDIAACDYYLQQKTGVL